MIWHYRIWGLCFGPIGPSRTVEAPTFRAAQDWIVSEILALTEVPQIWHVVIDDPAGARMRFDVDQKAGGGAYVSAAWV
jgi:hypothetical protein